MDTSKTPTKFTSRKTNHWPWAIIWIVSSQCTDEEKDLGIVNMNGTVRRIMLRNWVTFRLQVKMMIFERKANKSSRLESLDNFKDKFNKSMWKSNNILTTWSILYTPSSQPLATDQVCLGIALFLLEELGDNIKFAWGAWGAWGRRTICLGSLGICSIRNRKILK